MSTLSSDTIYYILTYLIDDYVSIGKIARVNWQFYDVVYFSKDFSYYDELWKQMSNFRWPFSSLGQLAQVQDNQMEDEQVVEDFSQVELAQLWRTFYLKNHELNKKWGGGRPQIDWKVKTIRQSLVDSWSRVQLLQTSGHLYTIATSNASDSRELFMMDRKVGSSNFEAFFNSSSRSITDATVRPLIKAVSLKDNFSVVYSLDQKQMCWLAYNSITEKWIHKEQVILTSDVSIASFELVPLKYLKKSQQQYATDALFKQLSNEFILVALLSNGSIQVFHIDTTSSTPTLMASFQAQKSSQVVSILASPQAIKYGTTAKQPFLTLPLSIAYTSDLEYWELQVPQAGKWNQQNVQANCISSTSFINEYQFQHFKEQLHKNEVIAVSSNKLVTFSIDTLNKTITKTEESIGTISQFVSCGPQTKQFIVFIINSELQCYDVISKRVIWKTPLTDTCCAMTADANRIGIASTNSKNLKFFNTENGKDYGYLLMYGSNFSGDLAANLDFSHSAVCASVGNAIRVWCFE